MGVGVAVALALVALAAEEAQGDHRGVRVLLAPGRAVMFLEPGVLMTGPHMPMAANLVTFLCTPMAAMW